MLLEGILLPVTTPFHADGRLFPHKLAANIERYSRTQAAGILVLSHAGEAASLSDAETREVLAAAIGAAADEKVMIAGVGRDSVAATLPLAQEAAGLGYDAIAVGAPRFGADAAMRVELMMYFRTLADRSALPLLLMSERERPLGIEVLGELAQHPNILGLADETASAASIAGLLEATSQVSRQVAVTTTFAAATGRMLRQTRQGGAGDFVSAENLSLGGGVAAAVVPSVKTRTKQVGFQILAASTSAMLEAWQAGAVGAVPRLGACAPQACCEVWQAFRDEDAGLAAEKQARVLEAGALVEGWRGIAALKYGCDLNAYFGGRPRLPLLPPDGGERSGMEQALAGIKN